MRTKIISIMATTGITIVALAIIGTFSGAKYICISSIYQSFVANIIIHLGYFFTHKIESEYAILEVSIDIIYTIIVLIVFGYTFDWFISTPIWILLIMSIVVYIIGLLLNILRIHEEIEPINRLLQQRNNKMN